MTYREIGCDASDLLIAKDIFVDNPDQSCRFIPRKDWHEIIFPEDFVASNDYENNCRAIIDVLGAWPPCQYFIKTIYTTDDNHPRCYKVNADADSIEEIYNVEDFSLSDYVIFDRTGNWGLYSNGNGFFSIGGHRELLDRIALKLGGASKLRSNFNSFVLNKGIDRETGETLLSTTKWPPT